LAQDHDPRPLITGWGHTPFGKLDAVDLEQLIRDAALPALGSAGLAPECWRRSKTEPGEQPTLLHFCAAGDEE
jgi:hypothetical protein